ncbi:hypothetical protein HYC85_024898 [Camellia sinensis]|uniref:non-specific serine/threonine protein kinase n=1 Tax=Camellia sinensis TaxID=4442 RepID=A0A7J7G9E3_CAMSI|nr:hypothetical protein HYC85_024898 [Camellia sinensis]
MKIKADGNDGSLILLKEGAEARVFESTFVGRRSIVKERFSKKYRHPSLDSKLTLKRLNAEARCMTRGRRLGDLFLDFGSHGVNEERMDDITMQIGDAIGKLHDGGLIHGDLTTSNQLFSILLCFALLLSSLIYFNDISGGLVLIDFGLSFISTLPEDKAIDLYVLAGWFFFSFSPSLFESSSSPPIFILSKTSKYVLERAFLSMHSSCGNVFYAPVVCCERHNRKEEMDRIFAASRKSSKQWSSTLAPALRFRGPRRHFGNEALLH